MGRDAYRIADVVGGMSFVSYEDCFDEIVVVIVGIIGTSSIGELNDEFASSIGWLNFEYRACLEGELG